MSPIEPATMPVNRLFDPLHLVQRLSSMAVRAMPDWTGPGAPGRSLLVVTGRSWQLRFHEVPAAVAVAVERMFARFVTAMATMAAGPQATARDR